MVNLDENAVRKLSKFMSLVLRHKPGKIGIELDEAGWTPIDELLIAMRSHGKNVTREILDHVVQTNDKQRFTIDEEGLLIRANQGHSVDVELGYEPATPPSMLLHGTPRGSVESIRAEGLKKMKRHHVHLHSDAETATTVGARRGAPVLLTVRAVEMASEGFQFYVTANEVWLTDHVPPRFIDFPD